MDGPPQRAGSHEIDFLEVTAIASRNGRAWLHRVSPRAGNLSRQAHVRHVAASTALHQSHGAVSHEPVQRGPHRIFAYAKIARQTSIREMNARLPFKVAVAQQVIVDRAVGHRKVQSRREIVLELLADECSIWFLRFHDEILKME